jgi:carbon-monoxide dehydrogenase medium subunit
MSRNSPEWLAPTSLAEALALRASFGDEATVLAGGTFIGILMNQNIMRPQTLLSLRAISDLAFIEAAEGEHAAASLSIGAMTTHRAVESSALVHQVCPILASTFSLVASPRVRNQATVGGVLADADYASDPPALLHALNAKTLVRSTNGEREIPVEELILGYYETSIRPDELLVELRIPLNVQRAVYRKFRSRSSEDRPCVAVAAAQVAGKLRVVVGAVAERPQYFPAICALADGEAAAEESRPYSQDLAREIGRRYAESIDPISDSRGSAEYRRRVIAVEVRRALEELSSASVRFTEPSGAEEMNP